jgi:hypothetical protein
MNLHWHFSPGKCLLISLFTVVEPEQDPAQTSVLDSAFFTELVYSALCLCRENTLPSGKARFFSRCIAVTYLFIWNIQVFLCGR